MFVASASLYFADALSSVSSFSNYGLCHCVSQCSRSNPQISQITQKEKVISHKKAQNPDCFCTWAEFTQRARDFNRMLHFTLPNWLVLTRPKRKAGASLPWPFGELTLRSKTSGEEQKQLWLALNFPPR